jgi:flagellar basal-body rod protein FlgG
MLNAIYIAAIGLQAQKEVLDSSANNFANMNTVGFKRQTIDFSSILNRPPVRFGGAAIAGTDEVSKRVLRSDMTPGALQQTGHPLDVAIAGSGFFEIELPDGAVGYSRGGSLHVNAGGDLSLSNGLALKAQLRIPSNVTALSILDDGSVVGTLPNSSSQSKLGQLELVSFADPEQLDYHGDGVYTAPENAPAPTRAHPGTEGMARLATGSVEASNVGMTNEMVSLMLTERVYELNSRVAQIADEMMGMANNLRR